MSSLYDLKARVWPGGEKPFQELVFLCPKCRGHEISIEIWHGEAGEHKIEGFGTRRLWHATQGPKRDFETLTLTPSIDRTNIPKPDPCGGWHGTIANGECAP